MTAVKQPAITDQRGNVIHPCGTVKPKLAETERQGMFASVDPKPALLIRASTDAEARESSHPLTKRSR
ncbi:MAG: hypothetical protein EA381_17850 [Planctomycetaceae bacterium]|nr:MAG: hypothetical protein EA381_17850 [Planctomycetaceae bacterium]